MENNDHTQNTMDEIGKNITDSATVKVSNNLDSTLKKLIGAFVLIGNHELLTNLHLIFIDLFASIKVFFRKDFGRHTIGIITAIVFFTVINLFGSFIEMYNSVGVFTGNYISYSTYWWHLRVAQCYVILSLFHWGFLQWRLEFRKEWLIYSYDHGRSLLYPLVAKLCARLKLPIISEFNFQRFGESGIVLILAIICKVMNIPLSNLLFLCSYALYQQSTIVLNTWKEEIYTIQDSRILQTEISNAIDSVSSGGKVHAESKIFNKAFANEFINAQKDRAKLNEDIEALIKTQKLDD